VTLQLLLANLSMGPGDILLESGSNYDSVGGSVAITKVVNLLLQPVGDIGLGNAKYRNFR
jgi:hypothetical protein